VELGIDLIKHGFSSILLLVDHVPELNKALDIVELLVVGGVNLQQFVDIVFRLP